ncbi:MAG: hypothetical protein ACI8P9_004361 [Parasphingorhabdus sp.]|jgi:uncharacterized protein (DUF58 family)
MTTTIGTQSGLSGVSYSLQDLLGLQAAAKVLQMTGRRRSRSTVSGLQESRIRGRGMSYAESRPYQPGDDVRQIDWRVTARSGRTHTKLYEEEKERPVFLILDYNHTMFFGSRYAFKHVVAAEAAALVGWSCVSRGDHVGSLLITPRTHAELKPVGGRRGLMRLFHAMLKAQQHRHEREEVSLNDAFNRALKVARPGSLIFIFSDFYHLNEETEQQLVRLRQHNDVVLCQVLDKLEIHAPPPGRYPISNGLQNITLDTTGALGGQVDNMLLQRMKMVEDLARRHKLAYGTLRADLPVAGQLNEIWR